MIQRILGLEANFKVHLLAYVELFPNRQMSCKLPWATDAAQCPRSIPQGEIVRTDESRMIVGGITHKILIHEIRPMIDLGCPHDVGALRAIGGNWISVFNVESQRSSIRDTPDTVRF